MSRILQQRYTPRELWMRKSGAALAAYASANDLANGALMDRPPDLYTMAEDAYAAAGELMQAARRVSRLRSSR